MAPKNNKAEVRKEREELIQDLMEKFKLRKPRTEIKRKVIPTETPVDWLIGGGIPLRAFTLVYGPKSAGKTTLAAHAAASLQRRGGLVIWADNENSFKPDYFAKLGMDIEAVLHPEPKKLFIEDIFELMHEMAEVSKGYEDVDVLFVWDSIAAAPSRLEENAAFNQQMIGTTSRALTSGFRRLSITVADFPNIAYLIINQVREDLSASFFGGKEKKMPGGHALEHWAALSLYMENKKDKNLLNEAKLLTRITIKKSKILEAPIGKSLLVAISHGGGIDIPFTIFSLGKELGFFKQRGGYYIIEGESKSRRRDEILTLLQNDPSFRQEIIKKVGELWKRINGIITPEDLPNPITASE